MMELSLEKIWKDIWKSHGAQDELVIKYWYEIQKAYSAKTRYYHTFSHIQNMLESSIKFEDKIDDIQNIQLSIFYHDVVYSGKRKDNEELSAELARKHLNKLNYPINKIEKCCNYILATKGHNPAHSDNDLNYFLDFDLQKLGSNWEEYDEYSKHIRQEYRFYPDIIYKPGRKKVLEHFLNLEKIFKSHEFYHLYEKQARLNLLMELKSIH